MKRPLISVITCVYNSEQFVKRNIDMTLSQTFQDYEIVIVQNESSDSTPEIIARYKKKYPTKIVITKMKPMGISPAFNKGINASSGQYLIFMNSDDRFHSNTVLQDAADFISKNPSLDWFYGKANVVEKNGRSIGVFPRWKIFQLSFSYLLKFFNFIPHQATFMKRKVFDEFGRFDESIRSAMDPDLWMRVASKTKWAFMDCVVCDYMVRAGAQTSDINKRKENLQYFESVQRKYMNPLEFILARMINRIVENYNKLYR